MGLGVDAVHFLRWLLELLITGLLAQIANWAAQRMTASTRWLTRNNL
jgi:hypothetical protein